jgi:hypothetical protein
MGIIFGLAIHIIIAHYIHLIQECASLILSLTLFQNKTDDFKINKIFLLVLNIFILLICNLGILVVKDLSIIIILYGGIFSTLINYLFPTICYSMLVSKNSLVIWIGWLIDFIIISLGIISLIFKILL